MVHSVHPGSVFMCSKRQRAERSQMSNGISLYDLQWEHIEVDFDAFLFILLHFLSQLLIVYLEK